MNVNLEMSSHFAFVVWKGFYYHKESNCLKKDATFNPSETWTFKIVFRVLDFIKEKLKTEEIDYTLNGIDASGLFVSSFSLYYLPLIEDSKKQLPKKSIVGVSSFYFFPFSNSRMKLDYIKK